MLVQFMDYEIRQEIGRTERCQQIALLLQTVVEVTRSVWFLGDDDAKVVDKDFVHDKGGPVFLGIYMANRALNEMCEQLYNREFDSEACRIRSGIALTFLRNKMLAEGWCLGLVRQLGSLGDREFLYLAYTHGLGTFSAQIIPAATISALTTGSTRAPMSPSMQHKVATVL